MNLREKWLVDVPIAHRGFHSETCPENSLRSFERAIKRGYAIELDVQSLSDGEIAVFHDDNLQRMTGADQPVSSADARIIKDFRLLGTDQGIPLLAEVLDLVRGAVPLLIEIKNNGAPGVLEENLHRALVRYQGPYAIQSFNPLSVRWFGLHAPEVCRGQLSKDSLSFMHISDPCFIAYDIRRMPNPELQALREQGIPVLGWTVSSLEEYHRVRPWCDNVIFEGFDPPRSDRSRD